MESLTKLRKSAAALARELPYYQRFSPQAAANVSNFAKEQTANVPRQQEVPRDAPLMAQTVVNDEKPVTSGAGLYPQQKIAALGLAPTAPFDYHNRHSIPDAPLASLFTPQQPDSAKVYTQPNIVERGMNRLVGVGTRMANIGAKPDNKGGFILPKPSESEIFDARRARLLRQSPYSHMPYPDIHIYAERNSDKPETRRHNAIMRQIGQITEDFKRTGKNMPLKTPETPVAGGGAPKQHSDMRFMQIHPGQYQVKLPSLHD